MVRDQHLGSSQTGPHKFTGPTWRKKVGVVSHKPQTLGGAAEGTTTQATRKAALHNWHKANTVCVCTGRTDEWKLQQKPVADKGQAFLLDDPNS
mmetsp:Transcript_53416/g.87382  ORF Transcript_53416/g.87382 Transcript_53416/m.87382 type:complete len:94 (+) Transcript_53416:1108-1389(+)